MEEEIREDQINETKIQTFQVSKDPLVVWFEKVLKDHFCDEVIKYAEHIGFDNSRVIDSNNVVTSDVRTGSHAFDHENQLEFIFHLFASITGYPRENFEDLQILKYEKGEKYGDHFDFFNVDDDKVDNDRVGTVMAYLNDGFIGGDTNFPELEIKISPNKGGILFFEYSYDKETNLKTLHSGLPVEEGVKYVIVTWIRENKYEPENDKAIKYIENE